jgi:uncharacterized protein (TIGR03905 family)
MEFNYHNRGTCSTSCHFEIEDGKLHHVSFANGCYGNLKAIGRLLEGQEATQAVAILKGNDCRGRGTSCADQLARHIEDALTKM